MKASRVLGVLTTLIASTLLAGCPGIPNDDRYQIHDGGRSNTRAQAPAEQQETSSALVPVLVNDGRYQTRGGGWDNFRAEAAIIQSS